MPVKPKERKKLREHKRARKEILLLIYEITTRFNVTYLDELPAEKAWGFIFSEVFNSDLIKKRIGIRETASIELNGGR